MLDQPSNSTQPDSTSAPEDHARVRAHAEELASLAGTLGLESMSMSILSETERRLAQETARVVVLGEIKHGKSSLINAVVGVDVLPVGVTPTTSKTVTIRAGEPAGQWLIEGDQRTPLEPDRFQALVTGQQDADGRLEVTVESSTLPSGIELIDTPGINDIEGLRAAVSRHELPRADAVIVVLDATQLLNRSEATFIRDVLVAIGGLGPSGASMMLVINRIDLVPASERESLRSHLRGQLDAVLGEGRRGDAVRLFELSAKQARQDREGGEGGSMAAIVQLRAALADFARDRAVRLPGRARGALIRQLAMISYHAAIQSRALELDEEAIAAEIQQVRAGLLEQRRDTARLRQKLATDRDQLLAGSRKRIDQFREQLQTNALAHVQYASLRTLATNFPGSIHDAFLAFANEETGRLRTSLDDLTRRALHTHSELVHRNLARATLRLGLRGPTVYVDPPSLVLEASAVAVGLVGTAIMYFGNLAAGMTMTVAGPLATVMIREQTLRRARAQAREALPAALTTGADALSETLATAVNDHIASLEEQLTLADDDLGLQLVTILERARQSLHTDDGDLDTVANKRAEAKAKMASVELRLRRLREDLGTG